MQAGELVDALPEVWLRLGGVLDGGVSAGGGALGGRRHGRGVGGAVEGVLEDTHARGGQEGTRGKRKWKWKRSKAHVREGLDRRPEQALDTGLKGIVGFRKKLRIRAR